MTFSASFLGRDGGGCDCCQPCQMCPDMHNLPDTITITFSDLPADDRALPCDGLGIGEVSYVLKRFLPCDDYAVEYFRDRCCYWTTVCTKYGIGAKINAKTGAAVAAVNEWGLCTGTGDCVGGKSPGPYNKSSVAASAQEDWHSCTEWTLTLTNEDGVTATITPGGEYVEPTETVVPTTADFTYQDETYAADITGSPGESESAKWWFVELAWATAQQVLTSDSFPCELGQQINTTATAILRYDCPGKYTVSVEIQDEVAHGISFTQDFYQIRRTATWTASLCSLDGWPAATDFDWSLESCEFYLTFLTGLPASGTGTFDIAGDLSAEHAEAFSDLIDAFTDAWGGGCSTDYTDWRPLGPLDRGIEWTIEPATPFPA